MEVNMQDAHFELPHPLSPAQLEMLHLNPQSTIGNRQSAREDV
jgi:hypothetical protein